MDNTNIDNNLGSSTASAHEEVSTAQGHNKTGGRSSTQGKQSESVDTGAGSEAPKEDLEKPHGETSSKSVDGYPGEAREDPSVPTWTDKETVSTSPTCLCFLSTSTRGVHHANANKLPLTCLVGNGIQEGRQSRDKQSARGRERGQEEGACCGEAI